MEWKKLVQIDKEWINKYLLNQHFAQDFKLKIRGYSIRFSGNLLDFNSLGLFTAESIEKYVYSSKQIEELGEKRAWIQAQKYFGKKDPNTDGKYGEVLLFLLVESVLGCPMVAHKIKSLTNPKDQIKGGDGIFLGEYEYQSGKFHSACLIGESKIMDSFAGGIEDAFLSLDRFHNELTSAQFSSTEFMVAKQNLSDDFDLDSVYDAITPGSEEYRSNILVHPIFIMYNTNEINNIERQALTQDEAEEMIKKYFSRRGKEHLRLIQDKLANSSNLQKVFLDFFIIPVHNVQKFRNTVFYHIHGVDYNG
ncbi:DUF1837 domain-containing protein [Paenibacillus faecis]|uniref:DUF1837 domain-containing protein n=1 Tax=Paenibacillus faecis TaxID=862114 RepID=A0A5D0CV06_9BACL|nr:Hachiman antiphage defense system protein HamA [Paenibacillus faecis]TYA13500.1 DUF1837 domain-containing protein [Paenibacillus faecis]